MIFSWVRVTPGTPVASIYSVVFNLTEPVLGPLRRVIPPVRMGMAAIDLSPLIIIVGDPASSAAEVAATACERLGTIAAWI